MPGEGGNHSWAFSFFSIFLVLLVLLNPTAPLSAQTPPPPPTPVVAASPSPLPEPAWVELGGLRLIKVYPLQGLTAADRAEVLRSRLEKVLGAAPETTEVTVESLDGTTVLLCNGIYLISVSNADTLAENTDVATLSARWARSLGDGLQRLARERTGEFLRGAVLWSGVALALGVVLHFLLRWMSLRWLSTPGYSIRALSWLMVITFVLWEFPNTRYLANDLVIYAVRPLGLLLVVVSGAFFASFVLVRLEAHFFRQSERMRARRPQASPRWRQRLQMGRQVCQFLTNMAVAVMALVAYVELLHVNVGAWVAGAGVLGVGLGLAAQDILKDWMAGINIILEDQFGTGDVIQAGDHVGTVESFTLRITQLRDMAGGLTTLPNSQIRTVCNMSNLWAQVDTSVPVNYQTDLRLAMQVLERTARQLHADWPDKVISDPEVLGVEEFGEYAIRLRVLLRTAPLQQFPVRRELLLRLKEAFEGEGIEVAYRQIKVTMSPGT